MTHSKHARALLHTLSAADIFVGMGG